jgi:hypothetical protein
MKLKIGFLFLTLISLGSVLAQTIAPPSVEWQLTLEGDAVDQLRSVHQTSDGGYFVGGYFNGSTNSTKLSPGFGALDYWIVRLDANAQYVWD